MRFLPGLILVFALTLQQVNAAQYEGHISAILADGTIKFTENRFKKSYDLTFKDDGAKASVSQLKKNDFVSFEGLKNPAKTFIRVDSINYVGLADLLAIWTGDDKYCYKFSSFTEFSIYPNSGDCKKPIAGLAPAREFAYTINSGDDDWFMLLSDTEGRYAADLKLIDCKNAEMRLYDVNTGNIIRLIKLTK